MTQTGLSDCGKSSLTFRKGILFRIRPKFIIVGTKKIKRKEL